MTSPLYSHDDLSQLSSQGTVAQRIRALYDRSTGSRSRSSAAITSIPSRLRPETVLFLQGHDVPSSSREAHSPGRIADQLIPFSSSPPQMRTESPQLRSHDSPRIVLHVTDRSESLTESMAASDQPVNETRESQSGRENGQSRPEDAVAELTTRPTRPITEELNDMIDQSIAETSRMFASPSFDASDDPLEGIGHLRETASIMSMPKAQDLYDDSFSQTQKWVSMSAHELGRVPIKAIGDQKFSKPAEGTFELKNLVVSSVVPADDELRDRDELSHPTVAVEARYGSRIRGQNFCGRFDVFLRERTDSSGNSTVRGKNATSAGTLSPEKLQTPALAYNTSTFQPSQRGGGRSWRWWKLVLNEQESPGHADQLPVNRDASPEPDRDLAQDAVTSNDRRNAPESSENTATGSTRRQRWISRAKGKNKGSGGSSAKSSHYRELTEESTAPFGRSARANLDGMRHLDSFGNELMEDDGDVPDTVLASLNSQGPDVTVPTIHRQSPHRRVRPPTRHITRRSRDSPTAARDTSSRVSYRNDGSDTMAQEWARVYQITEGVDNSNRPIVKQTVIQEGADGSVAAEVLVPAVLADEGIDGHSKPNRITVSIEDGPRKILRLEIFPGRATALVSCD